jgi:hypothetical protein
LQALRPLFKNKVQGLHKIYEVPKRQSKPSILQHAYKKVHSFLAPEATNISTKSTFIHRYQTVQDVEDFYMAILFTKE